MFRDGLHVIDGRIIFYSKDEVDKNFGDYLSEYYADRILVSPIFQADAYYLVGSAISDALVMRDTGGLDAGEARTVAYWCCGSRGAEPLADALVGRCAFFGARGPLTRDVLGLPVDTPLGDPGLLMPLIYTPAVSSRTAGKTVCVPHFSQVADVEALTQAAGADLGLSPLIRTEAEFHQLIDDIASAEFVLAGSLHAAIIAFAYGRPFSFWNAGYIDVPFKWADFAASLSVSMDFVDEIGAGRRQYAELAGQMAAPSLSGILGCCPFAVRPTVLIAALAREAGLAPELAEDLLSRGTRLAIEGDGFARLTRVRERQRMEHLREARQSQAEARLAAAGQELSLASDRIGDLARILWVRAQAMALSISQETPVVSFADQAPGTAFLCEGWTPPNEVGPWSLPPIARIVFPAGLGWETARSIRVSGYVFAPQVAPYHGRRRIMVWVNGSKMVDRDYVSAADQHGAPLDLTFEIPPHVALMGADLDVRFALEAVGTNASLKLGDDDRPIGLAIAQVQFGFEAPPPARGESDRV